MMKECKVSWSGMTMKDLNKDNNAIKNDYIDNLIYIAYVAMPTIKALGCEIEGFISSAKFNDVYKDLKGPELFWNRFRTSGNAIRCNAVIDKDNAVIESFLKTKKDKPISIITFKDYTLFVQYDKYNNNVIEVLEVDDDLIERVVR